MARVVLRRSQVGEMVPVDRSEVPDYYSRYPSFVDENGQKWAHGDPQAFWDLDRSVPDYDSVPNVYDCQGQS
jgi:hypothetical protein